MSRIWHHEECSFLTILDLYNKKYGKKSVGKGKWAVKRTVGRSQVSKGRLEGQLELAPFSSLFVVVEKFSR